MDRPLRPRPGKRRGRPPLKEPHVKICGYVTLAFANEIAEEAVYRGVSIGDLIVEAFNSRTQKTWKDGT